MTVKRMDTVGIVVEDLDAFEFFTELAQQLGQQTSRENTMERNQ